MLPQSSIGTGEIATGLADFVVGADTSHARVQIFPLEIEDIIGLDVTRFEGVLTWLPSSIQLSSLRIRKTTVLWSLFSSYNNRHAESLMQRISNLRQKVGASKIVLVSDTSTWGQERIVKSVADTAADLHVLDGDARQHCRILARRGKDGALSDWLKSHTGSLVVCSDSNVAQRVFCAAENVGLVMPDDVALVSLHDDAIVAMNGISAFQVPFSRIGHHAICSLTHRLVGQTAVPRLSYPWRLIERRSTLDSKTVGPLAVRAYQLIEREAGQGLTFDEVVRNLGVAHRTLSRQYASAFGITPSRHIRNVKLSLANTLLAETEEKVGEIALRCGFSDASKFCVFYKRETGRTPSEYREYINCDVNN